MAIRLLYLIAIRVFGWLALLGRSQAGAMHNLGTLLADSHPDQARRG